LGWSSFKEWQKTTPLSPDCTAPIIEFGAARITMSGGLLHVLERGAVLKRRGDEGGAHRMRRVPVTEPELAGVFPEQAVDHVRVHPSALIPAFAIVVQRRPRIDCPRVAAAALARHAQ